jgi:hypothetical protein
MDYKAAISQNTDKKQLSFNELEEIIVKLYGEEQNERIILQPEKFISILKSMFDPDSYTMINAFVHSSQLQAVFNWHYDTRDGQGYLTDK